MHTFLAFLLPWRHRWCVKSASIYSHIIIKNHIHIIYIVIHMSTLKYIYYIYIIISEAPIIGSLQIPEGFQQQRK